MRCMMEFCSLVDVLLKREGGSDKKTVVRTIKSSMLLKDYGIGIFLTNRML